MRIKLLAGVIILFITFLLQCLLASAGWHIALSYAALITFAFVFDFWELVLLVLIGIFLVNWEPAVSPELLVFGLYPVAVYLFRNVLHWQVWLENMLAIALGFLFLYLSISRTALFGGIFWVEVFAGCVFGLLILSPLRRWGNA